MTDNNNAAVSNGNLSSPDRNSIIGNRNINGGTNTSLGTPRTRPRVVRLSSGKEFTVWPMSRDDREANDIIHENIAIPPAVQIILDSPPVQRLANLKQLGCASNAYPCCTHTRKEHSLGVSELAGRLATNFKEKQPQLQITEKDVLCLRMAGLCHDLGHGPFSHAFETFLKAAYKSELDHPEWYEERNTKFKNEFGIDMPPLPEHYEHEDTSLMMIDAALASIGLEIDWNNLDEPLKQIGDGTDREKFGVDLGGGGRNGNNNDERRYDPFTSRDWIFIKECVLGGPLDEKHSPVGAQTDFIGRGKEKEFLFDIVNNRHNGLDVDKIDYFHRDSLAAYRAMETNLNIFLRDAVIAKAECPNPAKCFKCNSLENPLQHLMICYPTKHVRSAMGFFAIRMKNHGNVYTHKKTKAAELLMVDILKEADKHFCMLISTQIDDPCAMGVPSQFDDFQYKRLPISRAWMYPRSFLRLDDTIVSIIETKAIENPLPQLRHLRLLLNNQRHHKVYKQAGEEMEIGTVGGGKFWKMTETEILDDLLQEAHLKYAKDKQARYTISGNKVLTLEPDDIIVEKRELHYGRKDKNPVLQMRFVSKSDRSSLSNPIESLPLAESVKKEHLPMNTPQSFVRRTIRFFCRSHEKQELVEHCISSWKCHTEDKMSLPPTVQRSKMKMFPIREEDAEEEDHTQSSSQPLLCTQPDDFALSSPRKRKGSDSSDESLPTKSSAKKRLPFN